MPGTAYALNFWETVPMQIESTLTADSNEEYIVPVHARQEPPVLTTVFKAIVVETVKGFFKGIFGFFLRYIKHFLEGFRYFWNPSLRKSPFDKKDYKENCQYAFELAVLVLLAIIFLIKLNLIPPTTQRQLEYYNNDLSQMVVEFYMFLIFAVTYLVLVVFSIFSGRLIRKWFKPAIARRESDILFIYLNNSFFSLMAIVALWIRCSASLQTVDTTELSRVLVLIFVPLFSLSLLVWSIRFLMLNKIKGLKSALFVLLTTLVYTTFFSLAGIVICSYMLGI